MKMMLGFVRRLQLHLQELVARDKQQVRRGPSEDEPLVLMRYAAFCLDWVLVLGWFT